MSPEEEELQQKKEDLERLGAQLADREVELTTLRAELDAFHRKYLRVVGIRFANLDSIESQIAERMAQLAPDDRSARSAADAAIKRARESSQEFNDRPAEAADRDFTPSPELRKLYKEATRKLHPDLTTDEKEKTRRAKLMVEVNLAYEAGDAARIRAILEEWGSSPEQVAGYGPGAELVRAIRKIAQIRRRLAEIEAERTELQSSDVHRMWTECRNASSTGRDLLKEMARDIDAQIHDARARLERVGKPAKR
ncbi:MAG: molecular chaperone DnaJ [Planctomycetes bacterium]|nr:molecular chaperone DnaJ [Planctomycetota bacterium]